jgi:hypothetical protein
MHISIVLEVHYPLFARNPSQALHPLELIDYVLIVENSGYFLHWKYSTRPHSGHGSKADTAQFYIVTQGIVFSTRTEVLQQPKYKLYDISPR